MFDDYILPTWKQWLRDSIVYAQLSRIRSYFFGGGVTGNLDLPGAETIAGTLTVGGLLTVTSGQIKFPATQNPSANANTLDDYEEGTWTPVFTGSDGQSGQVYASQSGSYTKIGRLVCANYDLTLSTLGTITTNLRLSGFPFAPGESTVWMGGYWDQLNTAVLAMPFIIDSGNTFAALYKITAANTVSYASTMVQSDMTANLHLRGTISYNV